MAKVKSMDEAAMKLGARVGLSFAAMLFLAFAFDFVDEIGWFQYSVLLGLHFLSFFLLYSYRKEGNHNPLILAYQITIAWNALIGVASMVVSFNIPSHYDFIYGYRVMSEVRREYSALTAGMIWSIYGNTKDIKEVKALLKAGTA